MFLHLTVVERDVFNRTLDLLRTSELPTLPSLTDP